MVCVLLWEPWGRSASCLPLNPPFPTLCLSSWPQLPLFAFPLPGKKGSCSWTLSHPSPRLTAASGSSDAGKGVGQPPLQSYYCLCPPGCWAVREKGEKRHCRQTALDPLACGPTGPVHGRRAARLTALEPRPQTEFEVPPEPQQLHLCLSMSSLFLSATKRPLLWLIHSIWHWQGKMCGISGWGTLAPRGVYDSMPHRGFSWVT